jgi:hypothetical protein
MAPVLDKCNVTGISNGVHKRKRKATFVGFSIITPTFGWTGGGSTGQQQCKMEERWHDDTERVE